ncbi:MAG: T9SS type A sorting domain-containing protein, partial [Bacteroidetes bacterium]|nr:T9SS type A sorting domain-containing protein [Bacteroidota bacterium]
LTANDNDYKDVFIDMSALDYWNENLVLDGFRLAPNNDGETGDVHIDFIRFISSSVSVRSEGDATDIIGLGNKLQLYAEEIPTFSAMEVEWSVDKPWIASIDATGLLTAEEEGSVKAIATAEDGSGMTASFRINVVNTEQVNAWNFDYHINGWDIQVHSGEVSHSEGALKFTVSGGDPYANKEVSPWKVNDVKYAWMSVKNETSGTGGAIYIFLSEGGHDRAGFTLTPNDTTYRDIIVDMTKIEAWNKNLVLDRIRFDPNNGGEPGDIYLDFIRFLDELIDITTEGGVTEIDGYEKTLQLYADIVISDETNVTWKVDSSEIATIDANGLLTSASHGTVIVTATASDNTDISGSIAITVIDPNEPEAITIRSEGDATEINGIGSTLQFYAEDADNGNAANVSWSVDNIRSASINESGLLTTKSTGLINVKASLSSNPEINSSFQITITNNSTDITRASSMDSDVQIYPNPARGIVNIETTEAFEVVVLNVVGQAMYDKQCADTSCNIDVSNWKSGVYFVNIQCGGKVFNKKLIVE